MSGNMTKHICCGYEDEAAEQKIRVTGLTAGALPALHTESIDFGIGCGLL